MEKTFPADWPINKSVGHFPEKVQCIGDSVIPGQVGLGYIRRQAV